MSGLPPPVPSALSKTERLYALIEHLRTRRTAVTVAQLAERFAVTERTVLRDLAALRAQGVPVIGEPGRGGGLQLADGHSMPPLALSVDEAVSLWLSLRVGAALAPLPSGSTLAVAFDKVFGALPARRRREVEALVRRIVIGPPPGSHLVVAGSAVDPAVYRACESAFLRSEPLQVRYRDREGRASEREIEPHGLLVQAPLWYLVAFDRLRQAPRMFRLDRIQAAQASKGAFTPRDPRSLVEEVAELERCATK